ncbi:MAG: zinc finger AN1 domain-containing stress-associated protein [Methanoregula sp.]|jgi:hypothetical protein|uniref:AN1-type zinc finger domain-containing protein n=1 Tax=Methanoregula sp. TaxID=2052170 RepID=UPI003D131106
MTKCDFCKKPIEGLPFTCRRCGGHFCEDHRLPEYHFCRGLKRRSPIPKQVTLPTIKKIPPAIKPPTNQIPKDPAPVVKTPVPPKKINEDIDNIPREKLREIVKTYGETIIENPKRLRAILKDLCLGKNTREINAIMSSLEEKIPQEILKSKNTVPLKILLPQLKKRLSENTYYSDDLVIWSIKSWALALEVQNFSQK